MDDAEAAGLAALFGDARLLLIFDGGCGVCTRLVDWVRSHDRSGRVHAIPNQTPGLLPWVTLTRADVDGAVWAIARDGRRDRAASAVNRVLRELGSNVWSCVADFYNAPGVGPLEERLYDWFARNRGRFARLGVAPECERAGVHCE